MDAARPASPRMTVEPRWLLFIHRIPPKPSYLRVKIWRRLQSVGAIPVKNTVYVLPFSDQAREDLQWISQEIVRSGGEAVTCEAVFVEGLSDDDVRQLFVAARDADYAELATEAARVVGAVPAGAVVEAKLRWSVEADLARVRRRLAAIVAIDFFNAGGRADVQAHLEAGDALLRDPPAPAPASEGAVGDAADFRGRVWVTRRGIHVDRIASAWLIRRFIDPEATFRWVPGKAHVPEKGELRFDMFEGEFTHEGDLCTFEVLLRRFGIEDRALHAIADMVHDIDLKDSKCGRPETPGFERLIAGIALAHKEDDDRLARGSSLLDDFYESFRRQGG